MERTSAQPPESAVVQADFGHASAAREALIAALWRERELLDQLLFALTSQRFVLEARELRWLPTSSVQVGNIVGTLREHEVFRAGATEELAGEMDLPVNSTLDDLISNIDAPTNAVLFDLASALRASSAEIDVLVRRNDRLLLSLVSPDQGQQAAEVIP